MVLESEEDQKVLAEAQFSAPSVGMQVLSASDQNTVSP